MSPGGNWKDLGGHRMSPIGYGMQLRNDVPSVSWGNVLAEVT